MNYVQQISCERLFASCLTQTNISDALKYIILLGFTCFGFGSYTGKQGCKNCQKINRHPWCRLHVLLGWMFWFFQQTFRRRVLLATKCFNYAYIWIFRSLAFVVLLLLSVEFSCVMWLSLTYTLQVILRIVHTFSNSFCVVSLWFVAVVVVVKFDSAAIST